MITNSILTLILLLIALQTAIAVRQTPRPVDGVLPHPPAWELQRAVVQINNILNWSK